jgi:hypothetical protein
VVEAVGGGTRDSKSDREVRSKRSGLDKRTPLLVGSRLTTIASSTRPGSALLLDQSAEDRLLGGGRRPLPAVTPFGAYVPFGLGNLLFLILRTGSHEPKFLGASEKS